MNTWIAFFRGINVGGRNKLPMKELAATLAGLDLGEVRTYIQSGNVVFRAAETDAAALAARIGDAVEARFGFRPRVLVLPLTSLRAAAAACPYPTDAAAGKLVHFAFLSEKASDPDLDAMETVKASDEAFALVGEVLYLHTPSGFGRSRLAERVERLLGVPITARNLRTVTRVLEIAGEVAAG
jgi:uncharacterized protein (DUF1697 family)